MPKAGHKAQRTCLGCRQVVEQEVLVRYVLAPDGEVLVDYGEKLPGRGAYTHLDRNCLEKAVRGRQFDRSFRGGNRRPEAGELMAALERQIRDRVLNLLGMARKSGQAASGGSLVLDSMSNSTKQPALVLLAGDISPGIADKVVAKAARAGIPCHRLFDKDLLGQILGKGERSVVAIKSGPLAATISTELSRLKNVSGES